MAQTSHVSRLTPAVLTITGLAAACGVYYIIQSGLAHQPAKTPLHRSNAVHRQRAAEHQPIFWRRFAAPSPPGMSLEEPFGSLVVEIDGQVVDTIGIASRGLRPLNDASWLDDTNRDHMCDLLERKAVDFILLGCSRAIIGSPVFRESISNLGLGGFLQAVGDCDKDALRQNIPAVAEMLGRADEGWVERCTNLFLESQVWSEIQNFRENDDVAATEQGTDSVDDQAGHQAEPGQDLKGLLYHIAEDDAKRKAYEHRGFECEECGESPIRGVRWHCLNCSDFDLCSLCESHSAHPKTHVFAKIKIPLPVLSQPTKDYRCWYAGNPGYLYGPLDQDEAKHLSVQFGFEVPQIYAMFDQFMCCANVQRPSDPTGTQAAIDAGAFRKALSSERWPNRFCPNALYDRMFHFYDTNDDGVIVFEEFLSGQAYLRGRNRFKPLDRALEGFDIDGDHYVDRADFLRLLKAKHEIHRLMINDMVSAHEHERTEAAMGTIRSSQPISSDFTIADIPQASERTSQGKFVNEFGDMQPGPHTSTVLDDNDPWPRDAYYGSRLRAQNSDPRNSHGRLQAHLSRFEELLQNSEDGENAPIDESGRSIASVALDGSSQSARNAAASRSELPPDQDVIDPLDQDILWEIAEDAFNSMLDDMFKLQEQVDEEIIATREERQRWRREIRAADQAKQERSQKLERAAEDNSLHGEADNKSSSAVDGSAESIFQSQIVPTDSESLEQREAEIAQQPLAELLSSTGYSTIDPEVEDEAKEGGLEDFGPDMWNGDAALLEGAGSDQQHSSHHATGRASAASSTSPIPGSPSHDPTLPQNRPSEQKLQTAGNGGLGPALPDASGTTTTGVHTGNIPTSSDTRNEKCPSQARLERLAELDRMEPELQKRGAPGRLSFEEIKSLVGSRSSLERLVTGWLEWAFF